MFRIQALKFQALKKSEFVLETPQKRFRKKRSAEYLEKLQELLNSEESFSVRKQPSRFP